MRMVSLAILSIDRGFFPQNGFDGDLRFLARALISRGFPVGQIALLSEEEAIEKRVEEVVRHSPQTIVVGDLVRFGHLMRTAIAGVFGISPLCRKEADPQRPPYGVFAIPNRYGVSSGFVLRAKSSMAILMPHLSFEGKETFFSQVIPLLDRSISRKGGVLTLFFCLLSKAEVDPHLHLLERENPGMRIRSLFRSQLLTVYLMTTDSKRSMRSIGYWIRDRFSSHCFSEISERIEMAVHEAMVSKGGSLALAESCTGGQIAARLTAISGASAYFLGSFVVYSDALKSSLLGVSPTTLAHCGAVSGETVIEMVRGLFAKTGARYAIAISGIAGPTGGSEGKPVGTVWGAIGDREGEVYAGKLVCEPTLGREAILCDVTNFLLGSFWRYLVHRIPPFRGGDGSIPRDRP